MKLMTKLQKAMKSKKGFTLIELIVVIAILAVLAAIMVPSMMGFLGSSKEGAANANAKVIFNAAQTYAAQEVAKGNSVAAIDMSQLSAYCTKPSNVSTVTISVSNNAVTQVSVIQNDGTSGVYKP